MPTSAHYVKVGLVGKPNVGKSTFFKAATLKDVATADYPFTTIEANVGVGHVRTRCPCKDLDVACTPAHGECRDGTRFVPVELVDVAGLVPGAHQGKGMGNKFLDDLRQADALIHVVDASGSGDAEGNAVPPGSHDPLSDVRFLAAELQQWIDAILADGWDKLSRGARATGESVERPLAERLGGLGMTEGNIHQAVRLAGLDPKQSHQWGDEGRMRFAAAIRDTSKPVLVAFNKADKVPKQRIDELVAGLDGAPGLATAADAEVALRGAAKAGLVAYEPGGARFEAGAGLSAPQAKALDFIHKNVLDEHGSTGVLEALETAVYTLLRLRVVYPVEDENKYSDKKGRVLPDAHLVPAGTTARDLAYRVHTELGERFIRAVDARTRRVIGADHELASGDVVRIVADS